MASKADCAGAANAFYFLDKLKVRRHLNKVTGLQGYQILFRVFKLKDHAGLAGMPSQYRLQSLRNRVIQAFQFDIDSYRFSHAFPKPLQLLDFIDQHFTVSRILNVEYTLHQKWSIWLQQILAALK